MCSRKLSSEIWVKIREGKIRKDNNKKMKKGSETKPGNTWFFGIPEPFTDDKKTGRHTDEHTICKDNGILKSTHTKLNT